MRNKFGTCCMILGTALLAAALSLFFYNQRQATAAEQASMELMVHMAGQIHQRATEEPVTPGNPAGAAQEPQTPADPQMTVVEIDGHGYIGYLSVPELELELPVMDQWSYPKLKLAPCRYAGTVAGNDLVLMAHNYARHFGGIAELEAGDRVVFTDMDGAVTRYRVAAKDILAPNAVDEMTAGNHDLTLFTCTYGGKSRVTVYCDREEGETDGKDHTGVPGGKADGGF